MDGQFDGVLVVRDELAGFFGGIAEYKGGKGSDLGHWLACWQASPMTVDRKTGPKKMIHIPRAAAGLIGGIQPGVLRSVLGREHMQDGLCARFLLAMPDPRPVKWTEATIDAATEAAIEHVYDRLLSLEPAADAEGNPEPFALPLTVEAKAVWIEYYDRHRAEQADLSDDLSAAWSKLEAYTARFALIFQLCVWASGGASGDTVDEKSMRAAIVLSDWFGSEARRVYATMAESDDDRDNRRLLDWITRRGGMTTAREVQQGCRWLREPGAAEAALNDLAKAGMGHWEPTPHGQRGQPTRRFILSTLSTVYGNTTISDGNGNTVDVDSVDAPEVAEDEDDGDWGTI